MKKQMFKKLFIHQKSKMSKAITIKNLNKSFRGKEIFRDLDLEVNANKITAVFGPNGCGKSTLFNILTGVTRQDSGTHQITNLNQFNFSYIFQNYRDSLLPWRKNYKNLALPLQIRKLNKSDIKKRIEKTNNDFDFKLDLNKYPYQLSGGQQQLLTFMRTIITQPDILLLDEPFSALDYENNLRLRNKLQKYYLQTNSTIFIITHNIEEAVYLADEIIVLSRNPTNVLGKVKNPLPYPRTIDTLKSDEFKYIKDQVLELFKTSAKL